jgi:MFS family permease
MGWLGDKIGRRRMAGIGFAASSIIFLFYLTSKTQTQLLLVSLIVSTGLSATSLLLAIIPEITPPEFYGTAAGIYGSFEDLGSIVGPLVFGFVWITFSPSLIFAVGSLATLICALLVLAIKPKRARN